MNWVDAIILFILIFSIVKGWRRGFFRSLIGLVGFFLSVFLATSYLYWAKGLILRFFSLPSGVAALIGFLIIFLVLLALFHIIGSMVQRIVHLTPIGILDTLGGMGLGLLAGGIIASLLLLFLSILPLPEEVSCQIEESPLARSTRNIAPYVFGKLKEEFPEIKDEVNRKLLQSPLDKAREQVEIDSLIQKEMNRQSR
ncbi:MAG: hypothetical protein B1H40_01925 [Candidatus Latescibacteria bacterium 4484_181]|nr:MAG: hypothetical protein B1H40_01925 [Candidatus Latescibacteria bacterium 4484_181]RKY73012.1 MAG: hypothetical protein DRQ24_03545 [Candidatus Latescibacterota bacterium]